MTGAQSIAAHSPGAASGSARRSWIENAVFALLIAGSIALFNNPDLQAANWTYPYFSGAAHLDGSLEWRYSGSGYDRFRGLTNAAMRKYDFAAEPADSLRPYDWNSKGYLLVAWAAKEMAPWLSYINAVVALQCLAHIAITLAVAGLFPRFWQRLLFVAAYGANPLVIHVVTFAMYYFWQVVPAFVLLLWLGGKARGPAGIILGHLAMLGAYMIRPTVILLVAYVAVAGLVLAERRHRLPHAAAAALLLLGIILGRQSRDPWHTMYVGLGAYPNSHVPELSDNTAFDRFQERTGVAIDTDLSDGNFYDPGTKRLYNGIIRQEYLSTVADDPGLFTTNAAANIYQSFSAGHVVGNVRANAASVVIGAVVIAGLVVTAQWIVLGAVLAYAAAYAWFFPPIPIYMFGSYLLIVFGCVRALAWGRRVPLAA